MPYKTSFRYRAPFLPHGCSSPFALGTFRLDGRADRITMPAAAVEVPGRPNREIVSMPSLLNCPVPEQTWLKEAGARNGASPAPARLHGANGEQREVPNAGSWEPAVVSMVEFQHLGDNWD